MFAAERNAFSDGCIFWLDKRDEIALSVRWRQAWLVRNGTGGV